MTKILTIVVFFVFGLTVTTQAQLTPKDAVKGMARGINIGNTMEPPNGEGTWGNPPVKERAFYDYKNAGFTAVRIPITWDGHTSKTPPYTIDSTWLNRVEQVVNWGLQQGLFIIIDAHHEDWIKEWYSDSTVARFDSIWSQIATRFRNKSDSLIFEILNEPYPMSKQNVNSLNAQVLKIIRKTNPTRIVSYSGYMWSNSNQLDSAAIPDSSDKYLIGYYHSYDPYPFGLIGTGTYGSASDIAATKAKFDQVTAWSVKNNIPVILDEFGYQKKCDYNSRMCAYATVMDQALRHGVGAFAWDDGGDFPIYNRYTGGFNEIKDILIYTYPNSPNGLKISQINNNSIKLQWQNRNTESDSITVQRGLTDSTFADFAKVSPDSTEFIDTSVNQGSSYYYRLKIIMKDSTEIQSYPVMLNTAATAIDQFVTTPQQFELFNNYPNPFNPTTEISFSLPNTEKVTLKVYNLLGQEVAFLINQEMSAGKHSIKFDATHLPSGVYIYQLTAGSFFSNKKMMVLK